jgi:Flp pilus assembly pilin Flp
VHGFLLRLLAEEQGQDLIEYALLATFIGLAGISVFGLITKAIAGTYSTWNVRNNNIWEAPSPSGS